MLWRRSETTFMASVDLQQQQQQQQQQHWGFKFQLTDIPRCKHQFSASSS